jgi:hypothetical protein
MKVKLFLACCLSVASAVDAWAKPIEDVEPLPGQSRLRELSAAAGESRTFRIDLPIEARQFQVETKGGHGPLGIHTRSPSSAIECFDPPSVERGLQCLLGWQSRAEARHYLVTLTAGDQGYGNVELRVSHEPKVLRNGLTWHDIDWDMTGYGYRLSLDRPGALSLRTMGGRGDATMMVIHNDGSFGGRRVCESTTGGTSHRCDLPAAPAGEYHVLLRGDFVELSLLATWH